MALFNKALHLADILTESPSFDLKCLFGKYFDDFGYPFDQEPCPVESFYRFSLSVPSLALAFSHLSAFALSGFCFSSLFSSFVEGFR